MSSDESRKNRANNIPKKPRKVSGAEAVKRAEKKSQNTKVKVKKSAVLKQKSKQNTIFRRFGAVIILFFIISALYFSWLYAVPFILNMKISSEKVNDFIQPKFNLTLNYSNSDVYTTPVLGLGVRFKDLKILYPGSNFSDNENVFLKAKSANFEVAIIPLLMKTIKFNKFTLRGVNVNTYQDAEGKYAYQEHLISSFNPNMNKYVLEVPEIKLLSYSFDNYNQQTDTFRKESGSSLTIKPLKSKQILAKSKRSNTIILK